MMDTDSIRKIRMGNRRIYEYGDVWNYAPAVGSEM